MAESDRPHPGRARRRVVWLAVVVLLATAAAYVLGVGERLGLTADPDTDPAAVAPPSGLDLPEPRDAGPVAASMPGAPPRAGEVRRAVGPLLTDRRLGRRVGVQVAGLDGRAVYDAGPDVFVPASTMKLLTGLAALESLGAEHRFTTRVVRERGLVTLVGGGDPLLASGPLPDEYPARADLAELARLTARGLRAEGRTRVRVGYDDTLFTGPTSSPDWERDYVPDDVVSPITALWVDEGRKAPGEVERWADPSAAAGRRFAVELGRRGIDVVGGAESVRAPASAPEVATVESAELVEVVQHVLETSDNEAAEVLARQVALAEGLDGSFDGAGRAIRSVLARLGVGLRGAVVHDGSGLARSNRLQLRTLLETLAVAAGSPDLSGLLAGLPVAGFTGSLGYRFAEGSGAGLGRVRAKTGTLTGVHGLAGVVAGRGGTVMLFAAVADRVKVQHTLFARERLDRIGAALAGCRCS